MERTLTFSEVQRASVARANRWHGGDLNNWNITDWSNALAGEVGEVCNAVKKLRRLQDGITNRKNQGDRALNDEATARAQIGTECADVFLYLILVAHVAGVDLARVVIDKFNATSEANEFPERLQGAPIVEFTGVAAIAAERQRQVEVEGYHPFNDARYHAGQLARAGAAYAILAAIELDDSAGPIRDAVRSLASSLWPWSPTDFKNKGARRNLERAGALLAAQLDQFDHVERMANDDGLQPGEPASPLAAPVERPDWTEVYRNMLHSADRDQDLIPVTRETLRLARSALRDRNAADYYHNNGAAEREIATALGG